MAAARIPAPLSLGLSSRVLIAIVQCWVAAIVPASCTGSGSTEGVTTIGFPSFKGPRFDSRELEFSWDAGVLDGALHLTADDVYEPPVRYAPDASTWAGHARLRRGFFPLHYGYSDAGLSKVASFRTTFTMSVVSGSVADGGLLFEVLPQVSTKFHRSNYFPSASTTTSSNISVEMGTLEYYYDQGTLAVYVYIAPPTAPKTTPPAKYTVWIEYDAERRNLSVYVADYGNQKPRQATLHAPLDISDIIVSYWSAGLYFGFFASKNRLIPSCQAVVYSWNLTVDRANDDPIRMLTGLTAGWSSLAVRVLYVVSASAAAALLFAVATCCLASRYRALKMKLKLSKAMRRLPGIPREFRYAEVKKATNNFHDTMRLGSGGFGAVYKGAMIATFDGDDGRGRRLRYVEVAVKKFTRKENRSYDDFLAEVAVINRLRHRNIVPLIGWCYENGELLLVYQYMPNGSLDQHLFRENRHHRSLPILRWETRYNVIKDVTAGLHYVHHEYEHVVLHRDIKASNIMLDAAFLGRLGDFGLARVVAFDKTSFTDLGVAGTWGFISPEYAVSHKATRQTDVYAFGVLVLEVVTGKRSLGAADDEFPLLTDHVWWLHGEGRLLEAMDSELTTTGEFDADDIARLLLLGLACTNPNALDRPTMAEVVQIITKSMLPPDVPLAKPTFVWPPEGNELSLSVSDDPEDDDDDFVDSNHRDSDLIMQREETEQHDDSLATSMRSLDVTKRKPRNTTNAQTIIAEDVDNRV